MQLLKFYLIGFITCSFAQKNYFAYNYFLYQIYSRIFALFGKHQNISFILELQCVSTKYEYMPISPSSFLPTSPIDSLLPPWHNLIIYLNICYLYFKMCHICLYYQNKDQKSMKWNTQILLYLFHICDKIRMLTTYIIRPIPICPFRQDGLQKCLSLISKIKFFWFWKIFTNRKEIRKKSNRRDPLM